MPLPGCECRVCTSSHPRNRRLRTSALLTLADGRTILIDASTDFRQQALLYRIKRVDAVLFTHAHADHILGTDDLRAFNFLQAAPIPCFATEVTMAAIKRCFWYVFDADPRYEGSAVPMLTFNTFTDGTPFTVCGVSIHPFRLLHGKLAVSGFRIGSLAYATDCNQIPNESAALMRGVDNLVLDGLRDEPHRTHFTIDEAVATAQALGARSTALIHMTHTVEYEEVSARLPHGVSLAYDGMIIPVLG